MPHIFVIHSVILTFNVSLLVPFTRVIRRNSSNGEVKEFNLNRESFLQAFTVFLKHGLILSLAVVSRVCIFARWLTSRNLSVTSRVSAIPALWIRVQENCNISFIDPLPRVLSLPQGALRLRAAGNSSAFGDASVVQRPLLPLLSFLNLCKKSTIRAFERNKDVNMQRNSGANSPGAYRDSEL